MDDLSKKIQSLLSDPDSMKELSELAAMLREPETKPQGTPAPADIPEAPPLDFAKLLAVSQAIGNAAQDDTVVLLRALKPHLSPERARRADQAIRMVQLYSAAGVLRENGMLREFFGDVMQ